MFTRCSIAWLCATALALGPIAARADELSDPSTRSDAMPAREVRARAMDVAGTPGVWVEAGEFRLLFARATECEVLEEMCREPLIITVPEEPSGYAALPVWVRVGVSVVIFGGLFGAGYAVGR